MLLRPLCSTFCTNRASLRVINHRALSGMTQDSSTSVHSSRTQRQYEVLAAAEAAGQELVGLRLDAALPVLFPGRWDTSTGVKRSVRRREIWLNGSPTTTDSTLQLGDRVEVVAPLGCAKQQRHPKHLAGTNTDGTKQQQQQRPGLDVAYEDDHMAVVIKPQGLLSQSVKGAGSVASRVKYCLQPTPLPGALFSPLLAHRLDVGTGGLLLVAKTRTAAAVLSAGLATHNMQKRYLALVVGRLEGQGVIDHPMDGRSAVTLFSVESHNPSATFGWLTWVSLWPKTGRTHQLRKHMAYIGHPILGDIQYKHHRKADCTPLQTDITACLPQLTQPDQQPANAEDNQQPQQQVHHHQQQQLHNCDQQEHGIQHEGQQQWQLQQQQQVLPTVMRQPVAELPKPEVDVVDATEQMQATDADSIPIYDGGSSSNTSRADGSNGDDDVVSRGGCRQRGEVLQDGTMVGTCLWAVQLQLLHPVSQALLDIHVGDLPDRIYSRICELEAPAGPPAAAAAGGASTDL